MTQNWVRSKPNFVQRASIVNLSYAVCRTRHLTSAGGRGYLFDLRSSNFCALDRFKLALRCVLTIFPCTFLTKRLI